MGGKPVETAQSFHATIAKTVGLRYLWFEPGPSVARPAPLVLFLHGAGERGDDLTLLRRHGVPKLTAERTDWPFYACSPQCPPDSNWVREEDALLALLDRLLADHPLDPDRVYLTGLSMGGRGAWNLAAGHPERFAAVAPICGASEPHRLGALARQGVPVWAFHGVDDDVVPVLETVRAAAALEAAGGRLRVTFYPATGHDAWTRTYDDPAFWTWLLAQRRDGTAPPA
jgi:predicted peptidase